MRRKWYKNLLRRRLVVAVLLLVQVLALLGLIQSGVRRYAFLAPTLGIISAIAVLYIISRQDTAGYKLTWSILILVFPVFGGLLYLLYRLQSGTGNFSAILEKTRQYFTLPGHALEEAVRTMPDYSTQLTALQSFSGFPVYDRTKTEYFPGGEAKHAALLEDLEKAQKYIFMEYFIVQEGQMWDSVLEILAKKAAQGVEVRFLYDDMGCFLLLPPKYRRFLEEKGIRCRVFNPFRPFLLAVQNNRDHRKIAVIDGKVAYTGGVNLADEYINRVERFGHWRDAAIRLEGAAAWSMTVMFLEMWSLCTRGEEDFARFYPYKNTPCLTESDGFVQPYADTPLDRDHVGERTYMQMITGAKKYLYISTPYLIIDDSMLSALITAAQSGVDVRILTPEKWDKRLVHLTTRSYYQALCRGGVRIYEYTGGFNHAKTFVADDAVATVGTVNLDFRSLYLHFECGVKLYRTGSVQDIKKDFLYTISHSREITAGELKQNAFVRTVQSVLRLFAPLM
ncbi:MAG: cardiolipin synthase [Ruminococcaceae bacterium]|nr:cardiolipin synthase [Oscillospiraceae bacterium]